MPKYNVASVCFGQETDIQQGFARGPENTQQWLFGRRAQIIFSLSILLSTLGSAAHSAEPRRCLRDGQVIITNVTCELLGNATEVNPAPEKHFKRGEIEQRKIAPPPPVKTESTKSMSPQQAPHQMADSVIRQLVSTLITNVLLPVGLISVLVVWLKRRTRLKEQQARREPFAVTKIDIQPKHFVTNRRQECANVEPFIRDTSAAVSEQSKPTAWNLDLIRDLEWKRFEDVCQQYYQRKGVRSETTPLGPDGGIDIRLYQDDTGKATAIVQCKAWGERIVGVSLVRELLGVMTHEKIGKAFFMTSGRYSDDAKTTAGANRITLIDGPMLLEMFRRLPAADQEGLLLFATEGEYRTPTCPTCGIKMVPKEGKAGKPDFWGCPTYPRCRQTLGMRKL